MNKLKQFLNRPYSMEIRPSYTILVVTAIVLFVLGILQPFGINETKSANFIGILAFSGIGTIIGLIISIYILPYIFRSFYSPETWTIGKTILHYLLIMCIIGISVGLSGVIYNWIYFQVPPNKSLNTFIGLFFAVLIIFPIPGIISSVWVHNRMLAAVLREAQEMNDHLMARLHSQKTYDEGSQLVLTGITKESLEVLPENLLYIEAYGNYVKVNYLNDEKNRQKLLRVTIKQMEESLHDYSTIIRCHRAFLVNTDNIINVKGNSQGYRLTLRSTNEEIPVSRAYSRALKEQIEHPV